MIAPQLRRPEENWFVKNIDRVNPFTSPLQTLLRWAMFEITQEYNARGFQMVRCLITFISFAISCVAPAAVEQAQAKLPQAAAHYAAPFDLKRAEAACESFSESNESKQLYCANLFQLAELVNGRGNVSESYLKLVLELNTPQPLTEEEANIIWESDKADPRYRNLIDKSKYLFLMMSGFVLLLGELPEGVTKWSEEEVFSRPVIDRMNDNLTKPVVDKDETAMNAGHALAGSWYYMMARGQGYTAFESFVFSAIVSTLFWEYGLEMTAEKPSIQDLIVTPVGGALIGEMFFKLKKYIDRNNGELFGSQFLGGFIAFIVNPLDPLATQFHRVVPMIAEANVIVKQFRVVDLFGAAQSYQMKNSAELQREVGIGVFVNFKFDLLGRRGYAH